jgi:hypothetical protein
MSEEERMALAAQIVAARVHSHRCCARAVNGVLDKSCQTRHWRSGLKLIISQVQHVQGAES